LSDHDGYSLRDKQIIRTIQVCNQVGFARPWSVISGVLTMSRNPFDDVGKARGGTPQPFQVAAASVERHVVEAVKKVQEAPPQVLPDLITGEAYDQLVPQSIELVQQHVLDDARFENTEYKHLINLPTYQERERAAKALGRRGDSIVHDEDHAEYLVGRIESKLDAKRTQNIIVAIFWIIALTFGFTTLAQSGNFLYAAFSGFVGWWVPAIIWRIWVEIRGMSTVSGRAV